MSNKQLYLLNNCTLYTRLNKAAARPSARDVRVSCKQPSPNPSLYPNLNPNRYPNPNPSPKSLEYVTKLYTKNMV